MPLDVDLFGGRVFVVPEQPVELVSGKRQGHEHTQRLAKETVNVVFTNERVSERMFLMWDNNQPKDFKRRMSLTFGPNKPGWSVKTRASSLRALLKNFLFSRWICGLHEKILRHITSVFQRNIKTGNVCERQQAVTRVTHVLSTAC